MTFLNINYSKYAFLEDYVFGDVRTNFLANGYLTAEEFFCIVIWKSNRAKTAIKRKLQKRGVLKEVIKELTSQIFKAAYKSGKLEVLLDGWKIPLPMSSAI